MADNNSLNINYSIEAEMLSFARACNIKIELSVHETGLQGREIFSVSHSACKTPSHHSSKHLIIIHSKPET